METLPSKYINGREMFSAPEYVVYNPEIIANWVQQEFSGGIRKERQPYFIDLIESWGGVIRNGESGIQENRFLDLPEEYFSLLSEPYTNLKKWTNW